MEMASSSRDSLSFSTSSYLIFETSEVSSVPIILRVIECNGRHIREYAGGKYCMHCTESVSIVSFFLLFQAVCIILRQLVNVDNMAAVC